MIRKALLPANRPVVLYCDNRQCPLSFSAASDLAATGHAKVMVLEGGFSAWQSGSHPIVTSPLNAASSPVPVARISARELNAQLGKKSLIILDMRPSAEFRAGHLPGAESFPLEGLPTSPIAKGESQQIVVYDRNSHRSNNAARQIQGRGFNVLELSGGITVWAAMGLPIETRDQ